MSNIASEPKKCVTRTLDGGCGRVRLEHGQQHTGGAGSERRDGLHETKHSVERKRAQHRIRHAHVVEPADVARMPRNGARHVSRELGLARGARCHERA
jgi:hypothetical protein